ncbi:MAG: stage II sporulation protein E [Epulopiscium sp.]|nr:stage II sporulation protein E [Candidatus Epulonipiscium sp.]
MSRLAFVLNRKNVEQEKGIGRIFSWNGLLLSMIGFFIGRVFLFYEMNPMVIGYYAAFAKNSRHRFIIFISTVLGLLTMGNTLYGVKYILAILMISFFFSHQEKRNQSPSFVGQGIIGGLVIFSLGLCLTYLQGFLRYYLLLNILEGILVFTFTLIYGKGEDVITGYRTRSHFNQEQMIGLAILLSSAIAGIGHTAVLGVSIADWVSTIFVLILAYYGGPALGAVMGTLIGIMFVLGGYYEPWIIGTFSAAGMIGGLFKELGRLGVAAGFSLGSGILLFYFQGEAADFQLMKALVFAIPSFMVIPDIWLDKLCKNTLENELEQSIYMQRLSIITKDRLTHFSKAFKTLGDTFTRLAHQRSTLTHKEVSQLFDEIASAVCSDCGLCSHCWERDFYYTYQTAFSILNAVEKKGKINKEDIPNDFLHRCVKVGEFVATTNRFFEIYKLNLSWHNRMIENRALVSEQLYGVSSIMDHLSKELDLEVKFEDHWAEEIRIELENQQIKVQDTIVFENVEGRYEVYIQCKSCYSNGACVHNILPIIQKILGKRMKPIHECCIADTASTLCTIRFLEENQYKVTTGVARLIKDNQSVSGDNYSVLELKGGQSLLALSDGMGGGEPAYEESAATIELLEQFMESGFEKDIAVKMINSVLVLKSNEESFSTLDICVIDMYSGLCELIKIGAASTFIKRADKIEVMKSTTLPVGILRQVDIDVSRKRLQSGDMIVMVTDGVLDSKEGLIDKEVWIEEVLQNFKGSQPQVLADEILRQAKENSQGAIKDDMTVLVARVWKSYDRT